MLHWLGIEPNDNLVSEACDRSSIKVVKLEELQKVKLIQMLL